MSGAWHGRSTGEADTAAIGAAIGAAARAGDVVALIGELGAGKTRLVAGIASGMGLDPEQVSSPTFVLVHEYDRRGGSELRGGDGADTVPLVHIDAYRVGSLDDLESIGWERSGELQRGAVVAVEWADRIEGGAAALGDDVLTVRVTHAGDAAREWVIEAMGSWRGRMTGLAGVLARFAVAAKPARPPCPICRGAVTDGAPTAPFCSPRCRTVDLGRWLGGDYRVTRPIEQRDLEEG